MTGRLYYPVIWDLCENMKGEKLSIYVQNFSSFNNAAICEAFSGTSGRNLFLSWEPEHERKWERVQKMKPWCVQAHVLSRTHTLWWISTDNSQNFSMATSERDRKSSAQGFTVEKHIWVCFPCLSCSSCIASFTFPWEVLQTYRERGSSSTASLPAALMDGKRTIWEEKDVRLIPTNSNTSNDFPPGRFTSCFPSYFSPSSPFYYINIIQTCNLFCNTCGLYNLNLSPSVEHVPSRMSIACFWFPHVYAFPSYL